MGIKGLTALISEHAPKAIIEHDIKTLFGRKVAIDASMSIYQFLIAVRQKDGELLTNDAGETTSHLMGFFYRTIRIAENGIKPAYVFDGRPPELKAGVLSKRLERREEAKAEGEEAKETGTAEDVERFTRRTVKVTREHNDGAPSEAEAQCAELARGGKVYAAGSEDMDTLTFNTPILFRHLTFSEAKKAPYIGNSTSEKFIDLCILLGCDYLEPIRGIGPKNALKLIREFGGLKGVVEHLREKQAEKEEKAADAEDGTKRKKGGVHVPEDWPWEEAKKLFESPDVIPASEVELEWKDPDIEGLVQFLVTEKGFNEDRVRKGAEKLQKCLSSKQQGRLDGFFTVKPKEADDKEVKGRGKSTKSQSKTTEGKGKTSKTGTKRKAEEKAESSGSKKTKNKK
ncbi:PIN domain-like protein [Pisolithus orientalis]|uniref:PIN domain-like protein n=1 Tax=Pisolithus orientalis TaxID=936130 RepID=UPI0022256081|nr:PIN domain-like protein [Pisolithus orientalis]KAI6030505.1 PIN domain-like protein [Pisolithus orientalis]